MEITSTGPARRDAAPLVRDLLLLTALVVACYFLRMTALPIVGEEGRRARGAINMLESGDWIVVRQQGVVFPDRPPMTNWLIALTGIVRGRVDAVAIRLPSALAVLLTTWLIYGYGRGVSTRLAALAAAAAFATFGQVMQIGRMGESEAVFTLFVAAALLGWHAAYAAAWPRAAIWTLGYGLTALAALVKGLQAPIYFVAVTGLFLLVRRDWRTLLGRGQWVGLAAFFTILSTWQIPYYLATDWQSVRETWFAVVGPRLAAQGLLEHVATFPLETLVCLLPWSPVLLVGLSPTLRRRLDDRHGQVTFLALALAVTYPSVWFAAGAKGRYYLPLYPCFALLIGILLDQCVLAAHGSFGWRAWRHLQRASAVVAVLLGLVFGVGSVLPLESLETIRQPAMFAALFALACLVAAAVFRRAHDWPRTWAPRSVLTFAALMALFYNGAVINIQARQWQDLQPAVNAVRHRLPAGAALVSFGPVDHRFAYSYQHAISELEWPRSLADLPDEVQYFCFDRRRTDTPQRRTAQRGMKIWETPGELPFEWEEIGRVCCDRRQKPNPDIAVIVGRVKRTKDGALIARVPNDGRLR